MPDSRQRCDESRYPRAGRSHEKSPAADEITGCRRDSHLHRCPQSIAGPLRAAIHTVDPGVPPPSMRIMSEVSDVSVGTYRFQPASRRRICPDGPARCQLRNLRRSILYRARRTSEMGIRAALGARAGDLYGLILWQGMAPVVIGLLSPLPWPWAASRTDYRIKWTAAIRLPSSWLPYSSDWSPWPPASLRPAAPAAWTARTPFPTSRAGLPGRASRPIGANLAQPNHRRRSVVHRLLWRALIPLPTCRGA